MTARPLALLLLTAVLAAAASAGSRSTVFSLSPPKSTSLLKHSHVPVWFDHPDDHLKYDVDVIIQDMDINDEAEVPAWKARIDR